MLQIMIHFEILSEIAYFRIAFIFKNNYLFRMQRAGRKTLGLDFCENCKLSVPFARLREFFSLSHSLQQSNEKSCLAALNPRVIVAKVVCKFSLDNTSTL